MIFFQANAGEEGQAPLRLRLVRYEVADQCYVLGTTLRDRERRPILRKFQSTSMVNPH